MDWISLTATDQIDQLVEKSKTVPQVIFKHSTRCGTSAMVLSRFERAQELPGADYYFLDLIRFRQLSNLVSDRFQVPHESPQLLLIKNGACVYDESHMGITIDELTEQTAQS
ncbi:MAG: bacillithiol system redox-active protein YtxJ [Chitinophagaceae bacterium]|nr:bacillithiol system redox-active protein YtxJ [Chitinophagaceae bacterium]